MEGYLSYLFISSEGEATSHRLDSTYVQMDNLSKLCTHLQNHLRWQGQGLCLELEPEEVYVNSNGVRFECGPFIIKRHNLTSMDLTTETENAIKKILRKEKREKLSFKLIIEIIPEEEAFSEETQELIKEKMII